ncbi:uncharacterized protein LOC134269064 [Saccostrea cucullata]|uniref:uncharacterized protein LOC134269064 n=1 Tax=Saccostrea cuccullata TaxID=36930 RepID=UPI002ED372A3
MDSKTGILLIFCLASVVADSPPIMCPEDKLLECRDSPAMKSLWIEDACRFYDTLRNCYAQYSFECAETNNEVYFTMVQEMKTQKEIFCKEKEPVCDQKQLEACFAQNIDMKTTDLQKPDTFPDLCKSYGEFSKCYEQAVIPCYNDPSFQQTSPWESLFGQIKIICLSTPVCNYFEMSKCNSMMYEGLSLVTTIPTSKFITTSCEGYLQYKPCMEPLLGPCERSRLNPFPEFFQQVTSTDRFVSRLCIRHMKDLLVSASTCYDKTAIQSTVDTTCVNPLMTITFAGEPDERQICRKAKSYIECIGTLVGTECPDDTNAVKSISAYQEAWILETLSMIIGINCPPMGFLPTSKFSQISNALNLDFPKSGFG